MPRLTRTFTLILSSVLIAGVHSGCMSEQLAHYDVIIRNGAIYDGSGTPSYTGDLAIHGDRIVAVGAFKATAELELDATSLAIAPGFINMLSWAPTSLIADGRSQGDIRQGVTLEVFGEGQSYGPLNDAMKSLFKKSQGDIQFDIEWTTLGEYLEYLENRGISTNVASFVGASTVRVHELGYEDRAPSKEELLTMQELVRAAMREGALGVGSSLIYAPAFYAKTDELIALAQAAGEFEGMYISHMRSEGNRLLESLDELIQIAEQANVAAEVYHLKMSGKDNWSKFDAVVKRINDARARGLKITTDMYTYPAGSTGLDAAMPPWVQEGGYDAWRKRLQDSEIRTRVIKEMNTPTDQWENLMRAAGAEKMLLVGFRNKKLRHLIGKTLAEVAKSRGASAEETAINLVIEDGSRVQVVYFLMSEENVAKKVALPWMSFGSDAGSFATEGVFLKQSTHPRAYGNFARLLGRYVREQQVITLEEAIAKLSQKPASNLKLRDRGSLKEGYFADVVVFDPTTVIDTATFDKPHSYAKGMHHVFVNGKLVLHNGEHTNATPGRVVRGPGWVGWD